MGQGGWKKWRIWAVKDWMIKWNVDIHQMSYLFYFFFLLSLKYVTNMICCNKHNKTDEKWKTTNFIARFNARQQSCLQSVFVIHVLKVIVFTVHVIAMSINCSSFTCSATLCVRCCSLLFLIPVTSAVRQCNLVKQIFIFFVGGVNDCYVVHYILYNFQF